MRVYHGERRGDGCLVTVDGIPLPVRSDLSGATAAFDWGYVGNGQLSLALLSDLLHDGQKAKELFKLFERGVLADLPHDSWTVTDEDFAAALARAAGTGARTAAGGTPTDETTPAEISAGFVAFGDMPFQTGHLVSLPDAAVTSGPETAQGGERAGHIAFGDMPMPGALGDGAVSRPTAPLASDT